MIEIGEVVAVCCETRTVVDLIYTLVSCLGLSRIETELARAIFAPPEVCVRLQTRLKTTWLESTLLEFRGKQGSSPKSHARLKRELPSGRLYSEQTQDLNSRPKVCFVEPAGS